MKKAMDFLINTFLLVAFIALLFIVGGIACGIIEHWLRVRRAKRRHNIFMKDWDQK